MSDKERIIIMQPLYIPPDLGFGGRLIVYGLILVFAVVFHFLPGP